MCVMVSVNVSLRESRIPWEMALWACLWGIIFLKKIHTFVIFTYMCHDLHSLKTDLTGSLGMKK